MALASSDNDLDLEVDPQENDYWCELCGMEFYESHYHCAQCMEVSSMFGHWDADKKEFTCQD